MIWTQADLDALKTAYKSGITRVRYQDTETTYRSLAEMRSMITEAERELSNTTRTPHKSSGYSRRYQS